MPEAERDAAIRGKTIRFIFTEGATAGKSYDHEFGEDGKVAFREVSKQAAAQPSKSGESKNAEDRVAYGAFKAAEDVYAVSYLSAAGYTLTVVLNLKNQQLVGFASGEKMWQPVRGTFEMR